jgi:hypothetical protein
MSAMLNSVPSTMYSFGMAIYDEDRSELTRVNQDFNYRARHPSALADQSRFLSLWPNSSFCGGDPTLSPLMFGQDNSERAANWEPLFSFIGGAHRTWFLKGMCRDSNGNALAAVNLSFFLTATNAYIGSCITDTNGLYSMPMPVGTGPCYGEANYSNNNLIGATVNTLQSAL